MYRPHSLEVSNRYNVRYLHVAPQSLNHEQNKLNIPLSHLQGVNVNLDLSATGSYLQQTNMYKQQYNPPGYRLLPRRMDNLDYQISHLIRESDAEIISGMSQSQSFSEGPLIGDYGWMYRSHHVYAPISHKSRLSTCMYMSPPSPHWTTVGNIMSVKRSTSMPGSRPNSVSIPCQQIQRGDVAHNSMKKKCGPFQCIKHQFRKVGHKDSYDNQRSIPMTSNLPSQKTPKSMFKKRSIAGLSADQSPYPTTKSKGLRKSISLLFSKSQRSSKSDPSITNKKAVTDKQKHNDGKDNSNSNSNSNSSSKLYQYSTRRNRSYESMLESGDVSLSTDSAGMATATGNKSCSYSDVQDSSSFLSSSTMRTKPTQSVDMILCRRSPSEVSLTDTVSVSSSEHQLSSQTASCQGNINYRTEDNGWKTVVGNVCRSNSKDSAIANSTLSGDGILNQSKRVSLTSTISRISDLTTASEDFNDSSYSSFNDLQTNMSQYSYSKSRLIDAALSNLEPIKINCDTGDSDLSPSSDSSTETLRPLSSLHCRSRYRSSYSDMIPSSGSPVDLIRTPRRKRSHSWPGCLNHLQQQTDVTTSIMKPLTTFESKPVQYPRLKMSYIQQSHLNSSPFLSQYSRLYSLRTSTANDQRSLYCISNQIPVTSQAPISSPIRNYPITAQLALPRRQSKISNP